MTLRDWEGEPLDATRAEALGVKRLTSLRVEDAVYKVKQSLRSPVAHTIFVYPVAMDRFEQR